MEYILDTNDYVGVSFWIATAVMLAGALFFFVERSTVKLKLNSTSFYKKEKSTSKHYCSSNPKGHSNVIVSVENIFHNFLPY